MFPLTMDARIGQVLEMFDQTQLGMNIHPSLFKHKFMLYKADFAWLNEILSASALAVKGLSILTKKSQSHPLNGYFKDAYDAPDLIAFEQAMSSANLQKPER